MQDDHYARDANIVMFAFFGATANAVGTLIVRYTGAFGAILYLPCWLVGTICGMIGLSWSFWLKDFRARIWVWALSAISLAALVIASYLPT